MARKYVIVSSSRTHTHKVRETFMKSKKSLMLHLALVSFALNVISVFLSILNQQNKKTIDMEAVYQKYRIPINKKSIVNEQNSLYEDSGNFPQNILT